MQLDPIQEELTTITLRDAPSAGMLGAPEVLQFGANFIKLIGAKRALDVGMSFEDPMSATSTYRCTTIWQLSHTDDMHTSVQGFNDYDPQSELI